MIKAEAVLLSVPQVAERLGVTGSWPARFNNNLRTPLATNFLRWLLSSSLSPPSMVDLP